MDLPRFISVRAENRRRSARISLSESESVSRILPQIPQIRSPREITLAFSNEYHYNKFIIFRRSRVPHREILLGTRYV